MSPQKAKRSLKDRVIFWFGVVTIYFVGTLGLFPLVGIPISLVHAVFTGLCLLAGSSLAHWAARRFFGLSPSR